MNRKFYLFPNIIRNEKKHGFFVRQTLLVLPIASNSILHPYDISFLIYHLFLTKHNRKRRGYASNTQSNKFVSKSYNTRRWTEGRRLKTEKDAQPAKRAMRFTSIQIKMIIQMVRWKTFQMLKKRPWYRLQNGFGLQKTKLLRMITNNAQSLIWLQHLANWRMKC